MFLSCPVTRALARFDCRQRLTVLQCHSHRYIALSPCHQTSNFGESMTVHHNPSWHLSPPVSWPCWESAGKPQDPRQAQDHCCRETNSGVQFQHLSLGNCDVRAKLRSNLITTGTPKAVRTAKNNSKMNDNKRSFSHGPSHEEEEPPVFW